MNENEKKEAIVNFAELKRRMKAQELKNKAKEAGKKIVDAGIKTIEFVEDHKEAFIIAGGATAGLAKITRMCVKHHDDKKAAKVIYDHSSGQYMSLKRPLKQKEKLEAFERNQRGEKYVDIYRSMGVLR